MDLWLRGAVVLPDRVAAGLIHLEGSKIAGFWDLEADPPPAISERIVDLSGFYLAPGFIDLHVHGGGGADFMDGEVEAVRTIVETHARHGTTGLLATTLAAPEEEILQALRAVKTAPKSGANILGVHMEGPFINARMKGALDARFIRGVSLPEIERWLAEGGTVLRWHVTIAPEVEKALDAVAFLAGQGAVVSAGHTDCTYVEFTAAVKAGLAHATHLFNAMRGLHHREPGPVGAALTLPGVTVEVIADGIHVHPSVLKTAVLSRGQGGIILVTDAMRAAGLPDGGYMVGHQTVEVKNGEARLANGTLAGSILTMDRAVANMVQRVGVSLPDAVQMASFNPARLHGLHPAKGSIAAGKDADLVVLDRELDVAATIIGGRIFFDRGLFNAA